MINWHFNPFAFLDEIADINSNCDWYRVRCQRAHLLVRYVPWIVVVQQLQSVCEKILFTAGQLELLWIDLLWIVSVMALASSSSVADVPGDAAAVC